MGWDVYASVETKDGKHVDLPEVDYNCTHNINRMIREAGMDWSHDRLSPGIPVGQFAEELAAAIKVMERDPERFRAMDPSNGWGSFDSLLPLLRRMRDQAIDMAQEHPSAVWSVTF